MGAQASSPLPFHQWSAHEVGISAARLIDPQNPQPCIAFFVHNNLSGISITSMPNLTEVSNLLFRCGNADILHHRILRLFLTLVPGGLPCEHPFIEAVRGSERSEQEHQYRCLDCKCQVTDPHKIQREVEKRANFLQHQHMRQLMHQQRLRHLPPTPPIAGTPPVDCGSVPEVPSMNPPIGVSVAWLMHWTREHNCWHMPTWLVRRLFVLPLTSQTHCCYAELPHMQQQHGQGQWQGQHMPPAGGTGRGSPEGEGTGESKGRNPPHADAATGPAHTFICHKWGDLWGDLVQAISQHATDMGNASGTGQHSGHWDLKVYLDVFCCSPYDFPPASSSSSDMVLRRCQAFLLISKDPSQSLSQHLSPNEADKLCGDINK